MPAKLGRKPVSQYIRLVCGMKVRELRTGLGMSQADFGATFGVGAQTVSHWEAGRRMPDLERLVDMATGYGVTMDWLMGLED